MKLRSNFLTQYFSNDKALSDIFSIVATLLPSHEEISPWKLEVLPNMNFIFLKLQIFHKERLVWKLKASLIKYFISVMFYTFYSHMSSWKSFLSMNSSLMFVTLLTSPEI